MLELGARLPGSAWHPTLEAARTIFAEECGMGLRATGLRGGLRSCLRGLLWLSRWRPRELQESRLAQGSFAELLTTAATGKGFQLWEPAVGIAAIAEVDQLWQRLIAGRAAST